MVPLSCDRLSKQLMLHIYYTIIPFPFCIVNCAKRWRCKVSVISLCEVFMFIFFKIYILIWSYSNSRNRKIRILVGFYIASFLKSISDWSNDRCSPSDCLLFPGWFRQEGRSWFQKVPGGMRRLHEGHDRIIFYTRLLRFQL